jgi:hypothetical protein
MGNRLLRYGSAMMLLMYGFAKLNGSQFTILDSELDKPMGQVSGFWLTWYYFGYSAIYGNFLALVQIAGAMLLTFKRTALLGACVLAPVLGNIILIDILFGVDLSATLVAIVLLSIMLGIIGTRWQELRALFLPAESESAEPRWRSATKWAVRVAMLVLASAATCRIANFNNRAPTPIDGTWDMVEVSPTQPNGEVPARIFFEYNRAHLAVLKFSDGTYKNHHFEVGRNNSLQIWKGSEAEGTPMFEGRYTLEDSELRIEGTFQEMDKGIFRLQRRAVR